MPLWKSLWSRSSALSYKHKPTSELFTEEGTIQWTHSCQPSQQRADPYNLIQTDTTEAPWGAHLPIWPLIFLILTLWTVYISVPYGTYGPHPHYVDQIRSTCIWPCHPLLAPHYGWVIYKLITITPRMAIMALSSVMHRARWPVSRSDMCHTLRQPCRVQQSCISNRAILFMTDTGYFYTSKFKSPTSE